jgi:hypothetical protein
VSSEKSIKSCSKINSPLISVALAYSVPSFIKTDFSKLFIFNTPGISKIENAPIGVFISRSNLIMII